MRTEAICLITTFVICFFLAVSVVASAGSPTSTTEAGLTHFPKTRRTASNTLVPQRATCKYLDDGSDPGTNWASGSVQWGDGDDEKAIEETTSQVPPLSCLPRFGRPELLVEVSAEGHPDPLVVADLTQDGLPDVIPLMAEWWGVEEVSLVFLINDGSGGLVDATSSVFLGPVPMMESPIGAIVADFDGDTHLDLFIGDAGRDLPPFPGAQNRLFLSAPGGKLVDATSNLPQQLDSPHRADAADIDGDGDLDLYVGNIGAGFAPEVWVNDGSGAFTIAEGRLPPVIVDLIHSYTTCHFADVNEDGSPDLILGGDFNSGSEVLLNDGLGSFSLLPDAIPRKLWDETDIALDIQATDLNGDEHLDLLMLHTPDGYEGGWYIQILIGNGDSTFQDETDTRLPQPPNDDPWFARLELVDLDYDGDLDIATSGHVWVPKPPFYLNDGHGHFVPFEPPLDFGPFDFIDIDGNGRRDVVFDIEKDTHSFFVMRDAGCPAVYLPLILKPGDGPAPPTLAGVAAVYPVYGQVFGWDWSPHEELGVDLRTPSGRLRDTFTVSADSDGAFLEGFYYGPFEGDSITLVASSGIRHTFQVKLPRATADPETNTIVGVAEPSTRVEAWVWHPAGTLHQLETRAAVDGSFSFDFTPVVDWEYGDGLEVGQWVSEIGRGFITQDSPEMTVLEPGRYSQSVRVHKHRQDREARQPGDTPTLTPIASSRTAAPQAPSLSCLPRFSRPELQVEVPMVGEVPSLIFIADLNQDGLSDVSVWREEDLGGVALEPLILMSDGNGGLVDGTSSVFLGPVPKIYAPGFAVFEDFDQDGHLDMFITDGGRDAPPFPGGQNRLFLSAPGGKLVDATSNLPQQLDGPHGADGADIDGDGDVDLYVQSLEGPYGIGPEILLNDGTGAFTKGVDRLPPAQADPTQTSYTACLFADINEDGSPDLVLGSDISVDNVVLLNDGWGWFSLLPGAMPPKMWDPRDAALSIQPTDLNGDQHLDLLVLYARNDIPYSNNNTGRYIQILIGNGDGTFRDETDTRLPQLPNRDPWYGILELVDFDYDGDLDIATRGRIWAWGAGPPFYLNDGAGYFTPTEPPVEIGPMGFLDIDGNGRRDVFFSNDPRGVLPEQYFIMRDVGCPVAYLPLVVQGEGDTPAPGLTGVVNVYAESWDLGGWGWPPHEQLSVDMYAPTGRLMDTFFASADGQGNLFGLTHWGVPSENDWMTLIGSSGGRATFQVKFPRATADPQANTIVGVAEPNVELEAGVEHPEGTWHGLAMRAAEDGVFSFDFSPLVDWEYGDELFVGQYVSENARINITRDSPQMTVLGPGRRGSHR